MSEVVAGRISPEPNTLTKPKLRLMLAIDDIKNTAAQIAETGQRLGRAPLRLVALASVLLTSCAVARPTEVNASAPTPPAPTPVTVSMPDYLSGPGSSFSPDYGYSVATVIPPKPKTPTVSVPKPIDTPAEIAQVKLPTPARPIAISTPTPTPTEIYTGGPLVTTKDELRLLNEQYGGARGGEEIVAFKYIIPPEISKLFAIPPEKLHPAQKQCLDFYLDLVNLKAERNRQIAQGQTPAKSVLVGNTSLAIEAKVKEGTKLNIRAKPETGRVLQTLPSNTELTILSRKGQWLLVLSTEKQDNHTTGVATFSHFFGWVHADFANGIDNKALDYRQIAEFENGALDLNLDKALNGEDLPSPTPTARPDATPAVRASATPPPATPKPTQEQVKSSEVPEVKRRLVEKIRVPGQPDELRDAPFGITQIPPETIKDYPFDRYELSGIAGDAIEIDGASYLEMFVPHNGSWVKVNVYMSVAGIPIATTQAIKDKNGYFIPEKRTGGSGFDPELVFSIIKPGDQLIVLIDTIDNKGLIKYNEKILADDRCKDPCKKQRALETQLMPDTRDFVEDLMTGKRIQDGRLVASAAQLIMPNEPEKLLVLP
ncbi:hypothetical protein A2966_04315 [Candidatus Roizmanbacteria bacterium RIFCSPLOWO2_01_FULL_41_22]|uniref:SH3b domain-containing protein n=1 Tax=Candidatus Roizmanbacteria bacterium RIFCSPLOWO2_01_FULL_41_22 TaxID=1802067 RepID=A0A1F7J8Q7_9BACT|nr:MAG: hypothetical protein A2966_04315 [Candidatus Roizmanbacteria bacterium RIFCSPLOWO2_01_FULL_41_22]